MQFRQGDILLQSVEECEIQKDLSVVENPDGEVVLAYGEETGHAHRIQQSDRAVQLSETGRRVDQPDTPRTFLLLEDPVSLIHEEHQTIELPVDTFIVRNQREYAPEGPFDVLD